MSLTPREQLDAFHDAVWNDQRQRLEAALVAAGQALLSHAGCAWIRVGFDGGQMTIELHSYDGVKS